MSCVKWRFIKERYNGNYWEYRKARKWDYGAVYEEWLEFVIGLVHAHQITAAQYFNAVF